MVVTELQEAIGNYGPMVHAVAYPHEDAVDGLIEFSRGADLLVIGLRQRSPVGKLLLGSEGRDVILGAEVAVLAVPLGG